MIPICFIFCCTIVDHQPKKHDVIELESLERTIDSDPAKHKQVASKLAVMLRAKNRDTKHLLMLLGKIGHAASGYTNDAVAFLKDNDVVVRRQAAYTAGQICAEESTDLDFTLLRHGLKDDDWLVRQYCVYVFGRMKRKSVPYRADVKTLLQDKEPAVAAEAAYSYWRITGEDMIVTPVLVAGLKDEAAMLVSLTGLGQIGTRARSAFPHVAELTKHDTWSVRGLAVNTLCKISSDAKDVIDYVIFAQADTDPFVPLIAGKAFLKYEKEAVKCLADRIKANKNSDDLVHSTFVLGNFGEHATDTVPLLRALMTNSESRVRNAAEEAVERIRSAVKYK
jgi:hypothetical protein